MGKEYKRQKEKEKIKMRREQVEDAFIKVLEMKGGELTNAQKVQVQDLVDALLELAVDRVDEVTRQKRNGRLVKLGE